MVNNCGSFTKKQRKYINSKLHNNKNVEKIIDNSTVVTRSSDIPDSFNGFFGNVARKGKEFNQPSKSMYTFQ